MSLFLDLGIKGGTASPYVVRASDTSGLTEGLLAVPSVMAALAITNPHGPWLYWLQATTAAGFALLAFLRLRMPGAAHGGTPPGRQPAANGAPHGSGKDGGAANGGAAHHAAPTRRPAPRPKLPVPVARFERVARAPLAALCGLCGALVLLPLREPQLAAWPAWRQLGLAHASSPMLQLLASGREVALAAATPLVYDWLMRHARGCFSLGEGALLAQCLGLVACSAATKVRLAPLFLPAAARRAVRGLAPTPLPPPLTPARLPQPALLIAFLMLLLSSMLAACLLLWAALAGGARRGRGPRRRASPPVGARGAALAVLAAPPVGVVALLAAWTVADFLAEAAQRRLALLAYWTAVLLASLAAMHGAAASGAVPQIILRKGYHLLAMALFIPAFWADLPLLVLSMGVALAALMALEASRCAALPVLGPWVQRFMEAFVDERDSGVMYVTHFTLLLGLAVPVWVTLALPGSVAFVAAQQAAAEAGAGGTRPRVAPAAQEASSLLQVALAGLSGMMVVGVGDTAASVVGRLVGRRPIHAGSRKTVEGTAAGVALTMVGWWVVLRAAPLGGAALSRGQWASLAACTAGAGLLEAITSQLDNIMIPLFYLAHVLLV